MTPDEFHRAAALALTALESSVGCDWRVGAGTLEWSCSATVDHVIDCLFSYGLQFAARTPSGFLPLKELHAAPDATNADLLDALRGVVRLCSDVTLNAEDGATASDGIVSLSAHDWRARAAYELVVHTHDVVSSFGIDFELPANLCAAITRSPGVWMFDQAMAGKVARPWDACSPGRDGSRAALDYCRSKRSAAGARLRPSRT